jgi:hypothetical protein
VFLAALIGWLDRQQQDALAYLIEEKPDPARAVGGESHLGFRRPVSSPLT